MVRAHLTRERAAAAACALAVLAAAGLYALVGVHITLWEYEEGAYRLSATHYWDAFPGGVLHDGAAYATSRLYPLILSPLFGTLNGDDAIRSAKVLNTLLWVSSAIPLWLLARPLLTPWRRAAAVALGVVTPWMALTTLIFTENIAVPVFFWFTYAILVATRRPAWWRDLLALAALGLAIVSRAQLAGLLVGYLALIVWSVPPLAAGAPRPRGWRVRALGRHLRRFPATCVLVVLCALGALLLPFAAALSTRLDTATSAYTFGHSPWFADLVPLLLFDALAITCGVGVVAALFGLPWLGRSLRGGERDDRWWFAAAVVCAAGGLLLVTAIVQGGFWGVVSEERYWMYPAPLLWIAAFAAAQRREIAAGHVAVVGGALVLIAGGLELPRALDSFTVVFAPVTGTLGSLARHGLAPVFAPGRDVLAAALLLITTLCWAVLRLRPRAAEWLLGAGAGIQLALTVIPALAMTGAIVTGADRTVGSIQRLSWIDNAVDGPVTWLPGEPRRDPDLFVQSQHGALFYNRRVMSRLYLEGATPGQLSSRLRVLPEERSVVDPGSGVLLTPPTRLVVTWRDSPRQQPVGRVLARSPGDGQQLMLLDEPPRLRFRSTGLGLGDQIRAGRRVLLWFWLPPGRGAAVTLTFTGGDRLPVTVRVGGADTVTAPARTPVRTRLRVCAPAERVPVRIDPVEDAATLDAVAVRLTGPCDRTG